MFLKKMRNFFSKTSKKMYVKKGKKRVSIGQAIYYFVTDTQIHQFVHALIFLDGLNGGFENCLIYYYFLNS